MAAASGGKETDTLGSVGSFVVSLLRIAQADDTYYNARVLYDVLQYVFSYASKQEADLWVGLARKLEKTGE